MRYGDYASYVNRGRNGLCDVSMGRISLAQLGLRTTLWIAVWKTGRQSDQQIGLEQDLFLFANPEYCKNF